MNNSLHLVLIVSSVIVPISARADASPAVEGPAIVIGAFEVNGQSETAGSVDYPLELSNKLSGVYLTDFNQGVITADVSVLGFKGEDSSPHTRLVVDRLP